MKIFDIIFFAIPEREFDYIAYRHQLESNTFEKLKNVHEVKYIRIHEPDYTPSSGFNAIFFKGKNGFFHIPLSLILYVRRNKPDVVLIHGFVFSVQTLLLLICLPGRTKYIVQHHSDKPYRNRIKRWFQKLAYSRMDAYLFGSPGLADSLIKAEIIKDPKKVHEVMECSGMFKVKDKKQVRQTLGLKNTSIFLWVGRLDENKDPLCLLRAFDMLNRENADFMLYMIYGSSELEEDVKNYISAQGLTDKVKLVGKVPHPELENWFNAADYFVAASYYESSGLALCEAMSCGCVPVVTDIPAFRSVTDQEDFGYLFEPGNATALFHKLRQTYTSDYQVMRDKVIGKFNRDLSYDAIGRNIDRIIQNLS